MSTIALHQSGIVSKINLIIKQSGLSNTKWKIGAAPIQELSLLQVKEEIHYFPEEAINGNEIVFYFIGQGVQVCKMSKIHSEGIYIYR